MMRGSSSSITAAINSTKFGCLNWAIMPISFRMTAVDIGPRIRSWRHLTATVWPRNLPSTTYPQPPVPRILCMLRVTSPLETSQNSEWCVCCSARGVCEEATCSSFSFWCNCCRSLSCSLSLCCSCCCSPCFSLSLCCSSFRSPSGCLFSCCWNPWCSLSLCCNTDCSSFTSLSSAALDLVSSFSFSNKSRNMIMCISALNPALITHFHPKD